jgi:hypothetical protein
MYTINYQSDILDEIKIQRRSSHLFGLKKVYIFGLQGPLSELFIFEMFGKQENELSRN